MFTQCPACQTIFKLSAETLRAAAGEVRCGRCGEEFNALGSLAEEPQAFAGTAAQQAPRTAGPASAPASMSAAASVSTSAGALVAMPFMTHAPEPASEPTPAAASAAAPHTPYAPAPYAEGETPAEPAAPRTAQEPVISETVAPFAAARETLTAAESVPPAESPAVFEAPAPAESETPFEIETPSESPASSEAQAAAEFQATSESWAPMNFAADLEQTSYPGDSQTIADDPSLEFTLPPGELDRIFVEARPHHFAPRRGPLALRGLEELEPTDTHTAVGAAPASDAPAWITGTSGTAGRTAAGAAAAMDVMADDAAAPSALPVMGMAGAAPARTTATSASTAGATARAARMDDAPFTAALPEPRAGTPGDLAFDTAPDRRNTDLEHGQATSAFAEDALRSEAATETAGSPEGAALTRANWIEQILPTRNIEDLEPPRERYRSRWIAAAAALAVLLAVQLVHRYREPLAQAPIVGAPLRSLYALAGYPIAPRLNLAAFEIRPWGVTGDTTADGTLHVRASLINNGAEPQPYPLLRLKLEDRFGTRIGARDFQPAEYLHRTPQHALSPGERADLLIDILDPGKAAEGFELDVCEPRSNARVLCANDAPAGHRSP